jgi:hypothetical protein
MFHIRRPVGQMDPWNLNKMNEWTSALFSYQLIDEENRKCTFCKINNATQSMQFDWCISICLQHKSQKQRTVASGIIFWGNSSYAIKVFYLQKRMIRIIAGIGNRTSCKQSFIALKILTLPSLYIYSLLCFVIDNMDQYCFVSDIHNRNTRQALNLNLYLRFTESE